MRRRRLSSNLAGSWSRIPLSSFLSSLFLQGKPYCEEHYWELCAPRCFACQQPVREGVIKYASHFPLRFIFVFASYSISTFIRKDIMVCVCVCGLISLSNMLCISYISV